MYGELEGQVALVTGGSRGIGFAIANALHSVNATVVITARDAKQGGEAVSALDGGGERTCFIQADVTDREQVSRLVSEVKTRYGAIDILVNNAGAHDMAPFCEETEELWIRMYRANVLCAVFTSQAAVPFMKKRKGGVIINTASKAGIVGEPGHAAYSAAKGALIAMTRALAMELAPYGIRVNSVCPGPVETDMLRTVIREPKARAELVESIPLGRLGVPNDIAGIVLALAGRGGNWITGQAICIDGGMSVLL